MFNNSYDKPLTMSAHVPAPTQDLSSYSSRGVNDAADMPPSGLGSQYDFFQPDIQYRDFAQAPHAVTSSFRHPIPLVPGNADYTSGIFPPRREQFPPNAAAASSHLERGRQPAMSYGPTGPMNPNTQGEQPWGPGANFTGCPAAPTVSTYPPNFQPPQVYATPNAQGILSPTWQLSQSWIDYEGGEDLRLIILFKKNQPT